MKNKHASQHETERKRKILKEKSMSPRIAITVEGAPRERGRQYGEKAKSLIEKNIRFYRSMFETYGVEWEKAKQIASRFEDAISEYLPWATEEMKGIAEGAGVAYEDILALNCRSEIIFANPDGCSSLGILPELSENGHVLLGQTWDWLAPAGECTLIVRVRGTDEPDIVMCAEAGIIGGKGLNSEGIGVCLNALSAGKGCVGVPLHVMYRAILGQKTISNALDQVAHAKRAGFGNFAIGSAEGFLMCVEYTPDNFDVLMPVSEPMCHTNHYLSPLFASRDTFKAALTDTFVRLNRMKRMTRGKSGFSRDDLWAVFTDHANFPDSICSHEDPSDPEGKRLCTVYSVVMDLNDRRLWISRAAPCEGGIDEFGLED